MLCAAAAITCRVDAALAVADDGADEDADVAEEDAEDAAEADEADVSAVNDVGSANAAGGVTARSGVCGTGRGGAGASQMEHESGFSAYKFSKVHCVQEYVNGAFEPAANADAGVAVAIAPATEAVVLAETAAATGAATSTPWLTA